MLTVAPSSTSRVLLALVSGNGSVLGRLSKEGDEMYVGLHFRIRYRHLLASEWRMAKHETRSACLSAQSGVPECQVTLH